MNNQETKPEPPRPAKPESKKNFRRPWIFILGAVILAGLLFFCAEFLLKSYTHESTDDAFLDTHFVSIAAKVAGWIDAVHAQDNQFVHKGDLLLEIDPRDFEAKFAQKKSAAAASDANAKAVKASYELIRTRVETAQAVAKQSQAEAAAEKATADRAAAELKRNEDLRERNVIPAQEYDNVKAAAEAAEANLRAKTEQVASDESKVNEARAQLVAAKPMVEMAEAQFNQAQADQQLAELDLSYTKVVSPIDGRVTTKHVTHGNYVQVGQNLLAIVPTNLWVTANFKETQLQNIRPGQPVEIEIDSVSDKKFRGHVDSIQSGSGARFSLLPPENAVGNYVKVVQRVPVKILFDEYPDVPHALGPGLSVVPTVRTSDATVPAIVLIIGSILLAAIIAIFFWWMSRPKIKNP
jgi:membrane fusion protein (multidrug efflux system)